MFSYTNMFLGALVVNLISPNSFLYKRWPNGLEWPFQNIEKADKMFIDFICKSTQKDGERT